MRAVWTLARRAGSSVRADARHPSGRRSLPRRRGGRRRRRPVAVLFGRRERAAAGLLALLAAAGAGFVLARFLAYDPYYLPTLRRFSEGGNVRGAWIALVVAACLAAAAAT